MKPLLFPVLQQAVDACAFRLELLRFQSFEHASIFAGPARARGGGYGRGGRQVSGVRYRATGQLAPKQRTRSASPFMRNPTRRGPNLWSFIVCLARRMPWIADGLPRLPGCPDQADHLVVKSPTASGGSTSGYRPVRAFGLLEQVSLSDTTGGGKVYDATANTSLFRRGPPCGRRGGPPSRPSRRPSSYRSDENSPSEHPQQPIQNLLTIHAQAAVVVLICHPQFYSLDRLCCLL